MSCVRKEKVPPVSGKQKAVLCAQSLVPCTISPSGLLKDNFCLFVFGLRWVLVAVPRLPLIAVHGLFTAVTSLVGACGL